MRHIHFRGLLILTLLFGWSWAACDDGDEGDGDADTDVDSDVDSDSDIDSDVDSDGDGDASSDGGGDADADGDGGGCTDDFAPESVAGTRITLTETGVVENTWSFAATGDGATLEGTGDFAYTYERLDGCSSVLLFSVGGEDRYDMIWTSATGGTFEESFDGTPGNPGTFEVIE